MNPFELENRNVVITGASSGLGHHFSGVLCEAGANVILGARREEKIKARVDEIRAAGGKATGLKLDVRDAASIATFMEAAEESYGPIDVVINNAGQMFMGITEAFTADEVARQLDINVVGVHRVIRAFLPAMRRGGTGLIINVSSVAGRMSLPFFTIYHASKWALEGYSLGLRSELTSSGIDVVSVQPGPFTTELFAQGPGPADVDGRTETYPVSVSQARAGMDTAFEGIFADPEVPTDPRDVCDRMVELVNMTPGARPFRAVVGVDFGVRERNDADAPQDAGVLEALGLTEFATLKV